MKTLGKRFDVAVFPLADTVLFPGVTLPLKIFEKRFETMVHDVQARGWRLAVPLVVPCSPHEFILSTICGAGQIQVSKEYPNGNADILVYGKERIKLLSFVQQEPYFIMEAQTIDPESLESPDMKKNYEEFLALVKTWAFVNPRVPDQTASVFAELKTLSELCDFFVFHFLKNAPEKQLYLNITDPIQRAEMLSKYLENDLIRLTQKITRGNQSVHLH